MSIELEADDGARCRPALPGQYLTVRIPALATRAPLRSYSLSGDPAAGELPHQRQTRRPRPGRADGCTPTSSAGSVIEAAAPRGDFYLGDDGGPVVLVSAGIGITPVFAMLHALAAAQRARDLVVAHTHNPRSHAFATEVSDPVRVACPTRTQRVFYTAVAQAPTRLDRRDRRAGPARRGDRHTCAGPSSSWPRCAAHSPTPGSTRADPHRIVRRAAADQSRHRRARRTGQPHPPDGAPGTGPRITFARSGLTVNWSPDFDSILDLAEACDVPTRFSCRSGVCHMCVTPVIEGTTDYLEPPLEEPADGAVLLCTATPHSDLVLDFVRGPHR